MTLSYEERKMRQIQNAPNLSYLARVIRIADKVCNIRDIIEYPVDWTPEKKLNYVINSSQVLEQIKGTHPQLEELLQEEIRLAKQKLEN